jgi:hypothetical protein
VAAEEREQPQPGTAGMAQGQPGAGVEPATPAASQPEGPVTGGEVLERQQQDPDLEDTAGAHP